jgi:isoleucyl-tRNA synthetase
LTHLPSLFCSHILAGTIKDIVTRYAHQTGHFVSRRFGWDCHGLPVEYEIDKKLGITGRQMVLDMGVDKYNNECRGIVQRYTSEWEKTVTRLGRWIDFKNDYRTMDPSFMESVWWVFKTMFDKNLVYRGYKVMPYSTYCGTPLSNFEAGLNYKDVSDPAVVVNFPLVDEPNVALLAWTTTPWTLPSNLALCVNPNLTYVKIVDKTRNNNVYILLEARLSQLFRELNKPNITEEQKAEFYEILDRFPGTALVGKKYQPLFQYFAATVPNAFRVVSDTYVTDESGTGIVHQAPAFGEDDYRVCLTNNILQKGEDLPCPVDANGYFTAEVSDFVGQHVKAADDAICLKLKHEGRLVQKETYVHSYPFCWRSETPLIYKAVPSWFVKVEQLKERLLHNNAQTYWVPAFVQEKRFHNWLADAKDWAISRNRFWGTPIPLWCSDDFEEIIAVGSVQELEELSGVKLTDLHKEFVDLVQIKSPKTGKMLKRIDEVFDCWFESGSMPYAQLHYPFENSDRFEKGFPADFIAEGLDQTRGWFYTLMVISTALFDKPAFKNLIVNGLVLAADGKKMSKRLKNYPEPTLVVDKFGSDALRLYLINSPVVRADVLKFQEDGVSEVLRGVMIFWYNTFRFFTQGVDRWEASCGKTFKPDSALAKSSKNDVDIWILASSASLVEFVHQEMKAYRLYTVVPRLIEFIDELSKWYVRLNRVRIKGEYGDDEAYLSLSVLYEVLKTLTLIMTPFTPFFTEYLYQNLRKFDSNYNHAAAAEDIYGKAESVHYLMVPQPEKETLNPLAVKRFKTLQTAVTLARMAREKRKIRNNLPLREVVVVAANVEDIEAIEYLKQYFLSEVNTWNVKFDSNWENMCSLKVFPNWKDLGKRLGKSMKDVAKAVNDLTKEQIIEFMRVGTINLCGFELTKDDIVVKREFAGDAQKYEAVVSDDGNLLIAIDTTANEDQYSELRARGIVSAIQKLRKSSGLIASDRIEVFYTVVGKDAKQNEEMLTKLQNSLQSHKEFIVKRVRQVPVNAANLHHNHGFLIAEEKLKDQDISDLEFQLTFYKPMVALNYEKIAQDFPNHKNDASQLSMLSLAVGSYDYDEVCGKQNMKVNLDGQEYLLVNGVHYFPSVADMMKL